jgi:hypothetical protein
MGITGFRQFSLRRYPRHSLRQSDYVLVDANFALYSRNSSKRRQPAVAQFRESDAYRAHLQQGCCFDDDDVARYEHVWKTIDSIVALIPVYRSHEFAVSGGKLPPPRPVLIVAFDGAAPPAKLRTQMQRRKNQQRVPCSLYTRDAFHFDLYSCWRFEHLVPDRFDYALLARSTQAGEGEHKLAHMLEMLRTDGRLTPGTTVTLYSEDSDSTLLLLKELALCTEQVCFQQVFRARQTNNNCQTWVSRSSSAAAEHAGREFNLFPNDTDDDDDADRSESGMQANTSNEKLALSWHLEMPLDNSLSCIDVNAMFVSLFDKGDAETVLRKVFKLAVLLSFSGTDYTPGLVSLSDPATIDMWFDTIFSVVKQQAARSSCWLENSEMLGVALRNLQQVSSGGRKHRQTSIEPSEQSSDECDDDDADDDNSVDKEALACLRAAFWYAQLVCSDTSCLSTLHSDTMTRRIFARSTHNNNNNGTSLLQRLLALVEKRYNSQDEQTTVGEKGNLWHREVGIEFFARRDAATAIGDVSPEIAARNEFVRACYNCYHLLLFPEKCRVRTVEWVKGQFDLDPALLATLEQQHWHSCPCTVPDGGKIKKVCLNAADNSDSILDPVPRESLYRCMQRIDNANWLDCTFGALSNN